MLRRTSTTASGSAHQSDQEKSTRSNEAWLDLDRRARSHPVADPPRGSEGKRATCLLACLGVGIEGVHAPDVRGDAKSEAPIVAAELEHRLTTEVAKPTQRGQVGTLRVEQAAHALRLSYGRLVAANPPTVTSASWRQWTFLDAAWTSQSAPRRRE